MIYLIAAAGAVVLVLTLFVALLFRRVVPTNIVQIVQRRAETTSYGTNQGAGNVYYQWPSWLPAIGVTIISLPVSNFNLSLRDYEAYDKDRVPFVVDVAAFFRIKDTAIAAQRVASIAELERQLLLIVQGAVRKVLASDVIDSIMVERSKFGAQFSSEVETQLEQWGVESVKSMELMDLRDAPTSKAIANIMAKKTSHIEMESRSAVANNKRAAEIAEVEAQQAVMVRQQEAQQAVGERTATKDQAVGIAQQQAKQEVLTQEQTTREREMAVRRVSEVRTAEIDRDKQVVAADQDKQTRVIRAEGQLEAQRREAEGARVIGVAKGDADRAVLMAPVAAQIELAKEIGANPAYQNYLAMLKAIDAHIAVGSKQAEALTAANIKVIANAGTATEGVKNAMQLFSSKGGTELGAMIEGLAQTPMGEAFLGKFGISDTEAKS